MLTTENQAASKYCPIRSMQSEGDRLCIGNACMAWRWKKEKPDIPYREEWWPKTEVDAELRSAQGPKRHDDVSADAEWVPMVGSEDTEFEGGYWIEPASLYEVRKAAAIEGRRGFCGHFGKPDIES